MFKYLLMTYRIGSLSLNYLNRFCSVKIECFSVLIINLLSEYSYMYNYTISSFFFGYILIMELPSQCRSTFKSPVSCSSVSFSISSYSQMLEHLCASLLTDTGRNRSSELTTASCQSEFGAKLEIKLTMTLLIKGWNVVFFQAVGTYDSDTREADILSSLKGPIFILSQTKCSSSVQEQPAGVAANILHFVRFVNV